MTGATRREILAGAACLAGGAMALRPAALRAADLRPLPTETGPAGVLSLQAAPGRTMDVSVWGPAGGAGTILFSHGAASAPRFYDRFLRPWSKAGYRILAPLHVDSVEHPRTAEFAGMTSWAARIEDMRALSSFVGDAPWIAAGHSYGGLTALVMGGARALVPDGIAGPLANPRAIAAIAFSPPAPIPGFIAADGYAHIAVPALIQTGTRDIVPGITGTDPDGWKGHLAPYEAGTPDSARYGLVLEGVDHYYGGAICRHDLEGPMQLAQLDETMSVATRFADVFGPKADGAAREALDAALSDRLPVRLMRRT